MRLPTLINSDSKCHFQAKTKTDFLFVLNKVPSLCQPRHPLHGGVVHVVVGDAAGHGALLERAPLRVFNYGDVGRTLVVELFCS